MDGLDRDRRRRTLKERLGFRGIGCCGATWGFRPTTISVIDEDDEDDEHQQMEAISAGRTPDRVNPDPYCLSPARSPAPSGMNLAAALAAERRLRSSPQETEGGAMGTETNQTSSLTVRTAPGTPLRVSLMRLLEETDGGDDGEVGEKKVEEGTVGNDSVCCVCMGRKKGAAFIPCGHTFCRVCSRELWLNRGSCPLCNRLILEILDIF